jgi:uncharacterized protein YjbI with pentapeptide repeats
MKKMTREELINEYGLGIRDFSSNDFTGENLCNINVSGSNFIKCDFFNADISESNFSQCTMDESNFKQAKIRWSDLSDSSLRDCWLLDSFIRWTYFGEFTTNNQAVFSNSDIRLRNGEYIDTQGAILES